MKILPPKEKIAEAWSAIADNRVELFKDYATVISSDCTKYYTVTWDKKFYTSNDNMSYWQNKIGYPIIAVLILQGKLPSSKKVIPYFKDIPWKELNDISKNNYTKVFSEVLDMLQEKGVREEDIHEAINNTYVDLQELSLSTKRSALRPPISKIEEA